jgi:hypothetical protein
MSNFFNKFVRVSEYGPVGNIFRDYVYECSSKKAKSCMSTPSNDMLKDMYFCGHCYLISSIFNYLNTELNDQKVCEVKNSPSIYHIFESILDNYCEDCRLIPFGPIQTKALPKNFPIFWNSFHRYVKGLSEEAKSSDNKDDITFLDKFDEKTHVLFDFKEHQYLTSGHCQFEFFTSFVEFKTSQIIKEFMNYLDDVLDDEDIDIDCLMCCARKCLQSCLGECTSLLCQGATSD